MQIGKKEFEIGKHTYVMGILNITPDSFSDGGKFNQLNYAIARAERMVMEGVDIIDIGGESTRPGYRMLPDQEEIDRVLPVVEAIKQRFNVPVSLDSYKSAVIKEGIKAGIDFINDVWGLKYDQNMASVIAESGLPCCLMHNSHQGVSDDIMGTVTAGLKESIEIAKEAGIADQKIILDPGIGFGKTYQQNLQVIKHLDMLHVFGYPLLLGTSRKSVIGMALDLPVEERLEGTLATTILAVMKKCAFVRVHDIKENVRAIKMAETISAVDGIYE